MITSYLIFVLLVIRFIIIYVSVLVAFGFLSHHLFGIGYGLDLSSISCLLTSLPVVTSFPWSILSGVLDKIIVPDLCLFYFEFYILPFESSRDNRQSKTFFNRCLFKMLMPKYNKFWKKVFCVLDLNKFCCNQSSRKSTVKEHSHS